MSVVKTNIDEAIARITDWAGKEISYSSVAGGVTNPNYKVNVDGTNYFLKIPGAGTDFIDRENCHVANMIASDAKVGAHVYYYFEDTGVEVFEWLEGFDTTTVTDMYDHDICMAGIKSIRDFNNLEGAKMPLEQSIFEQADQMMDLCAESEYMPPWHETMCFYLKRIHDAFEKVGMQSKPCHNDYWFNNFMYNRATGEGKVIDIEYGSMNDPVFDAASWVMGFATDAMMKEACAEYNYGEFDDLLFAKMNLARFTLESKWMYWALQQTVNSEVPFDYYSWYNDKASRMRYYLADPRIDMWLNQMEQRPVWREKGVWHKFGGK